MRRLGFIIAFVVLPILGLLLISCRKKAEILPNKSKDISVMSFNIRFEFYEDGEHQWLNRREACVQMLTEKKPDILGIQEGLYDQVVYLEDAFPEYSRVGVGRDDGAYEGEFAAIFFKKDKYELIENGDFWLSETPDVPSLGWDAKIKRIVTWVKLKDTISDQPFYVFNTHFDHKGIKARRESVKLLLSKIDEIRTDNNEAVFITGDFNALISNPIFNPLHKCFFESRFNAPNKENAPTFNRWGKLKSKIDFIFYQNANINHFDVITDDYGVPYISDHYPLLSKFNY